MAAVSLFAGEAADGGVGLVWRGPALSEVEWGRAREKVQAGHSSGLCHLYSRGGYASG